MSGRANPARGDIAVVDLSPQAGSEMAGQHHFLILSEERFNVATGYIVGCPITSQIKGSSFEVVIPAGLRTRGCVVASEIRTLDYLARRARVVEQAPTSLLREVQDIVCVVVGCE